MTNNIDERLQRALHDEAAGIDPDQGSAWHAIQQRTAARRGFAGSRGRTFTVLAAAALAVVLLTTTLLVARDDGERVEVGPADTTTTEPVDSTTTTEQPGTTTSTTTTAAPPAEQGLFPGIWPFTSQAQVDAYTAELPADRTYLDPKATAVAFAKSYLTMERAVVVREEPDRWFTVVPRPGHPMRTRIHVADVSGKGSGPYAVTEARAANIVATAPTSGATVGRPVAVAGRSTAYEATIYVEVRDDNGKVLGEKFTMGGATEMAPFSDSVAYQAPTTPGGAIVFTTESAEDGTRQEATVVRVGFTTAGRPISVYFHRGDDLVRVQRTTASSGVLRAALEALVAGPQPSDGTGLSSPFSDATKDILADVALRSDGTAVVDLARTVDNANTSEGSKRLLAQLDATAFQFTSVKRIEYRLQGSCDAFWQWLQYGNCRVVNRP